MTNLSRILAALLIAIASSGCSLHQENTRGRIALVRAQGVALLSINGTRLDSASTAIVVVSGRNEIEFQWPAQQEDFRIPRTFTIIMHAVAGQEYVVAAHPRSGFLCAWNSHKDTGIDFSRHAGCVSKQPV